MWRTRWWDLAVAAVCVAVVVPSLALRRVNDLANRELLLLGGVLIAFGLAYLLLIRPAVRVPSPLSPRWRRAVYFPLTALLLLAGVALYPFAATLQTVVYPLVWVLSQAGVTRLCAAPLPPSAS